MDMSNDLSSPKKGLSSRVFDADLEGAAIYHLMMENPLVPLCIFNYQGVILDFSVALAAMLKCSPEELRGKKIYDYFDLEVDGKFCLEARKQLQGKKTFTGEIKLKTFDDHILQVGCTLSNLRKDLFLACFQDNTANWESEYFKDKFIYVVSHVSHELRRPLATVSACLDLFDSSFREKVKHMKHFDLNGTKVDQILNFNQEFKHLSTAAKSVEQMAALINSLLDLARLDLNKTVLNKQKFILEDLLRTVVEEARLVNPDRHIVLLGAEKGALRVDADPLRIREVVGNLISNAVKYSPSGGGIVVTVKKRGADALIAVRDQGFGIAPEEQSQIFKRFYMVPRTRQLGLGGLGLGLHISKQWVELHQGQIWLESKEGKGSTFYFTLPLLLSNNIPTEG